MGRYLFIGGSNHGQFIDLPQPQFEIRLPVSGKPKATILNAMSPSMTFEVERYRQIRFRDGYTRKAQPPSPGFPHGKPPLCIIAMEWVCYILVDIEEGPCQRLKDEAHDRAWSTLLRMN